VPVYRLRRSRWWMPCATSGVRCRDRHG